jgi:outer membrane biosynthesis protein TonB
MRPACTILMLSILLVVVPSALAQESTEALPKVVQHTEPIYPPLARQTRIQGEVSVKVTTDGESVREAVAETGHPLLRKAAEDNARTCAPTFKRLYRTRADHLARTSRFCENAPPIEH